MNYDHTLIVIRERSFLELLDLGMVVVRDRPTALGLAALAGIAPFAALNFWLLADVDFPRALWPLLLIMEAPLATVPLTIVLGDLMFGVPFRPVEFSSALSHPFLHWLSARCSSAGPCSDALSAVSSCRRDSAS